MEMRHKLSLIYKPYMIEAAKLPVNTTSKS